MVTTSHLRSTLGHASTLILASALLTACSIAEGQNSTSSGGPSSTTAGSGGSGGSGDTGGAGPTGGGGSFFEGPPAPPPCDPTLSVKSESPALLVNDPAVLAHFSMERVLQQLLDRSGPTTLTPLTLLQRLFDTENTAAGGVFADVVHCDSPGNKAFKNGPPDGCPRAKGALAQRQGLLTPGDADYFAPVALVSRFDLMPQNLQTCGEYRLVYAKWSGRDDPANRLFIIFEGALPNLSPGNVFGCHAAALHWASLEKEADPTKIRAALEAFYFDGLPGLAPLVDPAHFGLMSSEGDPYGSSRGQVRLSQRMQEPWEMREYHFVSAVTGKVVGEPRFEPVTVKNNPQPALFGEVGVGKASWFQSTFLSSDVETLAAPTLTGIRMATQNEFNTGESALESAAAPDYLGVLASAGAPFAASIEDRIAMLDPTNACDPADPLTAEALVGRATTQTCAGCHAPQAFLGPERKIGCGLVWPDSLSGAHIDEKGALSPALKEVFLPRRASVLTAYLQACDLPLIQQNLQPSPPGGIPPE